MDNILEVHGLNKRYEMFSLNDVSMELPAGYIMGFIGPNGSGKTTTIKSILNMTHYAAGEIRLFGHDVNDHSVQLFDQIGVVMDEPFYVTDWTALDVEKAVAPFYTKWDRKRYAELLHRFAIDTTKKVKELSRGMKVKLMTAVALSHHVKLLILDEPTSGLDPVARDALCELLREFVMDAQNSVLFSTHITSDLEKIADYITFILDGRIVFSGAKDELLESYVLVKGGRDELNAIQKQSIIGLRTYETGFEGMAAIENLPELPKTLLMEPISLEELIIHMNKGVHLHE